MKQKPSVPTQTPSSLSRCSICEGPVYSGWPLVTLSLPHGDMRMHQRCWDEIREIVNSPDVIIEVAL